MTTSTTEIAALHRSAEEALNRGEYREAHAFCIRILKLDPEFADAIFLLGMIALAHGQVGKALQLVDKALEVGGPVAEYLAQRARCLVLLNRDAAALEAARAALALEPPDALTLDTIGVALSKAGDHETAVAAFTKAISKEQSNAQFYFNLASSQEFLGRFDEAEQSYERAIALKPAFYRAHWALSELTRATPEKNHVERLERALESADSDADANLYLCHALARENESLGHYEQAFDYWQRAKLPKLTTIQFRMSEYRDLFAAIRDVCTAEFQVRPEPGCDSNEPIFVVGMPRTGTTLVERILATDENVFAAGELNDFGLCLKRATGTGSQRVLDPETIHAAVDLDWTELGRAYLQATRPRTGHTRHFIDKLPPNFLYAGFIGRALPNAKIICLRRNPLDTCLSNYRQLFSVNAAYYNYAYDLIDTGQYFLMFDALISYWSETLGTNFTTVRYEDIVASPEGEGKKLLEFCGLQWNDEALDFHAQQGAVATASAVQVRQPIYSSAVGRWRRYEQQLRPLKELLESHGIDCGQP